MTASITTIVGKDGSGIARNLRFVDISGTGAGPFFAVHAIADVDGALLLTQSNPGMVSLAEELPAGANDIGLVHVIGRTVYAEVTATLDTAGAYAAGDLLFDVTAITNVMRAADTIGELQSIQLIDEDDQAASIDLIFLSAGASLGAINSAAAISDSAARQILGCVRIDWSDYIPVGACQIATKTNIGLALKPASGTRNIYVAAITRGAPTHSLNGIRLRLGIRID